MKKRLFMIVLTIALLAATTLTGCQNSGRETIVVYNWGEYIANENDTYTWFGRDYEIKNVIKEFEAAYPQYRVKYLTYDDNEKMYPKIGKDVYDVIVPSDYMVVRLIKEDLIQPIDRSGMENVNRYLDPRLEDLPFDPDPAISASVYDYAIPYMYCTVGLIYNRDELGTIDSDDPAVVWDVLFDESLQGRVGIYSSMRESIGMALNYQGYSLNTLDEAQLESAKQLLINQRQTVRPLVGIDELKDKYISGELVAGIAWSGDHVVCQLRLEEDEEDPQMLQYVLPKGSNMSIDMMCIPRNAANVEGAKAFIDFMYRPEIALMNAVYVGYSTPNTAALAQLPAEIVNNRSYYPDEETIDTLEFYYSSDEIDSTYDQIWQVVMAN